MESFSERDVFRGLIEFLQREVFVRRELRAMRLDRRVASYVEGVKKSE